MSGIEWTPDRLTPSEASHARPQATPDERNNLRKFVESAPLYAKLQDAPWRDGRRGFMPESAEGYCGRCRTMRTFSQALNITRKEEILSPIVPAARPHMVKDAAIQGGPQRPQEQFEPGVYSFSGVCTYCEESSLVVVLDVDPIKRVVQKIGQQPAPWRRDANPLVRNALGTDFDVYLKAQLLIGSGFGMGACAYLRRLIENQIDPLLDKLIAFDQERGSSEERIAEIEAVRSGRDFSSKASAVYAMLPEALQVPGHNPLRTLHSAYSAGLHGLSDDECQEIAQDTVEALEHVIVHLAQKPHRHRSYVQKIRDLERRRSEWG